MIDTMFDLARWAFHASLILLLIWALRAVMNQRKTLSRRACYALWLPVLLRLLIPVQLFTASFALSLDDSAGARPVYQFFDQAETETIYIAPVERETITAGTLPASGISDTGGYLRLSDDQTELIRYAGRMSRSDIVLLIGRAARSSWPA